MFPFYNGCPALAFPLPMRTHGRQNQQPIKTPAVRRHWHMATSVNSGKEMPSLGHPALVPPPSTALQWHQPFPLHHHLWMQSLSVVRTFPFWCMFRFPASSVRDIRRTSPHLYGNSGDLSVPGPCPHFHVPSLSISWQDFVSKCLFSLIYQGLTGSYYFKGPGN